MNRARRRAVTAMAVLLAVCASSASARDANTRTLTVTLDEYRVQLSGTTLPVGAHVRFVVRNRGQVIHEVVLERAGARDHPLRFEGRVTEVEHVAPGAAKTATWVLAKPGDYQIACYVGNHY